MLDISSPYNYNVLVQDDIMLKGEFKQYAICEFNVFMDNSIPKYSHNRHHYLNIYKYPFETTMFFGIKLLNYIDISNKPIGYEKYYNHIKFSEEQTLNIIKHRRKIYPIRVIIPYQPITTDFIYNINTPDDSILYINKDNKLICYIKNSYIGMNRFYIEKHFPIYNEYNEIIKPNILNIYKYTE